MMDDDGRTLGTAVAIAVDSRDPLSPWQARQVAGSRVGAQTHSGVMSPLISQPMGPQGRNLQRVMGPEPPVPDPVPGRRSIDPFGTKYPTGGEGPIPYVLRT